MAGNWEWFYKELHDKDDQRQERVAKGFDNVIHAPFGGRDEEIDIPLDKVDHPSMFTPEAWKSVNEKGLKVKNLPQDLKNKYHKVVDKIQGDDPQLNPDADKPGGNVPRKSQNINRTVDPGNEAYHRDVHLPLEKWNLPIGPLVVEHSNHTKKEWKKDRYRLEDYDDEPPTFFNMKPEHIVEVHLNKDSKRLEKIVARFPYDDKNDAVLPLIGFTKNPTGYNAFAKTMWFNDKNDLHNTLDRSQYVQPPLESTAAVKEFDLVDCQTCGTTGKITAEHALGESPAKASKRDCPNCEGEGKVKVKKKEAQKVMDDDYCEDCEYFSNKINNMVGISPGAYQKALEAYRYHTDQHEEEDRGKESKRLASKCSSCAGRKYVVDRERCATCKGTGLEWKIAQDEPQYENRAEQEAKGRMVDKAVRRLQRNVGELHDKLAPGHERFKP